MMEMNNDPILISTHLLAKSKISRGVTIGARIVETEAMATASGTFPLARNTMTFDAVPLGQHPTKITPTATSFGKSNPIANANASNGIMIKCPATPSATSFGRRKTSLKSDADSVSPMPNMTIPNNGTI